MNNKNCLSEQNLILHYYEEFAATNEETIHLASCPACKERINSLRNEMTAFPDLPQETGPYAGTRMAARVTAQLKRPRKNWLPAIGTTAIACVALALSITLWSPQQDIQQVTGVTTTPLATNFEEEMSDIDFLEDLELLKELELLSQIEGV